MQTIDNIIETTSQAWSVDATEAFRLLSLPRRRCVRLNSLKMRKSTISELAKQGIKLEPLEWAENCYWVSEGNELLSTNGLVLNGEVFLQNAASFLPVLAIDPKAGESILDICAAPGGKTTHIASITRNKAEIIANDTSRTRFFKMREIFKKYGVNAETTLLDGRIMRKHFANKQFDKILLDAPCSGEAAVNPGNPKTYATWSQSKVKRLSRLQEQLIVVAYDLLKPGGVLVYSTCTIAPEENELVINYLLKRRAAELLPINIDITDARQGITSWKGKQLKQELVNTMRLLPSIQHEAFFTAKIQKPFNTKEPEDEYRV